MSCRSQSSPSKYAQAEAEQHQSRVFLTVQWLQRKQRQIFDDQVLSQLSLSLLPDRFLIFTA